MTEKNIDHIILACMSVAIIGIIAIVASYSFDSHSRKEATQNTNIPTKPTTWQIVKIVSGFISVIATILGIWLKFKGAQ